MAHLYKSRLQNYAQKNNIPFPTYVCEMEGPPHARLFRARVTVNGVTYEGPQFCTTVKDAEHEAAKIAFMSLAPAETQEDDGLSKSLLQELAQKRGLNLPVYATVRSGPPHMPSFVCNVEIAGQVFMGQGARTKKQAETNAAKVAYTALMQGGQRMNPAAVSTENQTVGAPDIGALNLQSVDQKEPNSANKMQSSIKAQASHSATKQAVNEKVEATVKHMLTSQPAVIHSPQPNATPSVVDATQLNIRRENLLTDAQDRGETGLDSNGKRDRSASPNVGAPNSVVDPSSANPPKYKTVIRAHKPGMKYDGPIEFADDQWVAMRVRIDEDQ